VRNLANPQKTSKEFAVTRYTVGIWANSRNLHKNWAQCRRMKLVCGIRWKRKWNATKQRGHQITRNHNAVYFLRSSKSIEIHLRLKLVFAKWFMGQIKFSNRLFSVKSKPFAPCALFDKIDENCGSHCIDWLWEEKKAAVRRDCEIWKNCSNRSFFEALWYVPNFSGSGESPVLQNPLIFESEKAFLPFRSTRERSSTEDRSKTKLSQ